MSFPRIAVLDPTPIGSLSATGQFKAMILADWPREAILEVTLLDDESPRPRLALGEIEPSSGIDGAVERVRAFNPDILYVRPEPAELQHLDTILKVLTEIPRPAILHIMDDWVAGGFVPTQEGREALVRVARFIAQRASLRFTDGPAYVEDFASRLQAPFDILLNGVDLALWTGPAPVREHGRPFTLTHMGNYDSTMSRQAIIDIAAAVESLNDDGVRFDVYVRSYIRGKAAADLKKFKRTRVLLQDSDFSRYVATLRGSDANVYAYNQDPRSVQYMGKGIPNKTCELLVAGKPILAYGPPTFAGIDYLRRHDAAFTVTDRAKLAESIRALRAAPEVAAARAMSLALEQHNAAKLRERWLQDARNVARMGQQRAPVAAVEAVKRDWWGQLRPELLKARLERSRRLALGAAARKTPSLMWRALLDLGQLPLSGALLLLLAASLTAAPDGWRPLVAGACMGWIAWFASMAGVRFLQLLGQTILVPDGEKGLAVEKATNVYQSARLPLALLVLVGALAGQAWWSANWTFVAATAFAAAVVLSAGVALAVYNAAMSPHRALQGAPS